MKKVKDVWYGVSEMNAVSSLLAILIGLFTGLLILVISNPARGLSGFGAILVGGFSDGKSMGQVLYFATPIIMTGLSVGFAARTGLFNIGGAGQFIMGAYAAILVGVKCDFLPGHLHWIAALAAAMLAGAIWGCVPGFLRAYRNVNVVISCIMMNYIGMYLVNFLVVRTGIHDPRYNQTLRVAASANLPKMGLDVIFRTGGSASSANAGIIFAVIFAVAIFIILEKTVFGYELKACGYNPDAALYAGINEKRGIIFSMMIAGALAGLGGAMLYLAGSGKGIDVVDMLAMEGFNGIPVALLALNNPIGIIFSGLFIAYLTVGGFNMQLYGIAPQVIEIIVAVIIYFSAFALLMKGFIERLNKNKAGRRAPQ